MNITALLPYGMKKSTNSTNLHKSKYQYNGIEFVEDHDLDWDMAVYRSLDGAMGTWGQVDPKAELMYSYTPYNAMNNNPISNIDPDGDAALAAAIAFGAFANLASGGDKVQSLGDFLGTAAIGAVAGAVGYGAGSGLGLGGIGFINGAATGAVGGAAGGFVGGAGNAWLGGASFGQGLGAGSKGAGVGAIIGGTIGGMSGGLYATNHGGKFWSGEGATYESLALGGASAEVGGGLEYSNKFAKEFSDTNFGKVYGLNELHADGTFPRGYTTKDGITVNSKGNPIKAVTMSVGGKNSNVYFAKSAFTSSEQLYLTMGHEYMHVGFNYAGLRGSTTANERE